MAQSRPALEGKRIAWLGLRRLADRDPRLDAAQLDSLAERAQLQLAALRPHHERSLGEALLAGAAD